MSNGAAQGRKESWLRSLFTVFAIPIFIAMLSSYVIPRIIEKSNRTEGLRNARLKKALEIGDRNRDFNGRLNRLKTRVNSFIKQSRRARLSESELRAAQRVFRKEYSDDYLELDKQAWWWYWDLEREGQYFELLSQDELKQLRPLIVQYGKNVELSIGAIAPLWEYVSSADFKLNAECKKRVEELQSERDKKSQQLSDERTMNLAKDMASIFARSQYEPED